jgi:hypothetical protein
MNTMPTFTELTAKLILRVTISIYLAVSFAER